MQRKRVERDSGNYSRSVVHSVGDIRIIASDVFLGVAGAVVMVGIPLIMALLKSWGWW